MSEQTTDDSLDQTGWKKLDTILKVAAKRISQNTPRPGDGIKVDQSERGSVISLVNKTDQFPFDDYQVAILQAATQCPNGSTPAWQQILLVAQDDSGNTNVYQMYVWGSVPGNPVPCTQLGSAPLNALLGAGTG
jgi:hypothetical protein